MDNFGTHCWAAAATDTPSPPQGPQLATIFNQLDIVCTGGKHCNGPLQLPGVQQDFFKLHFLWYKQKTDAIVLFKKLEKDKFSVFVINKKKYKTSQGA